MGVRKYFSAVVGSDKIKNMKPAPDTYLEAVKVLGFESSQCIAVEDTPLGVASAKAAGCRTIAVTHTHPKEELTEADDIIDSLADSERVIEVSSPR